MENYKYKFTICTAVFNGEFCLKRAWESLKKQSFLDFEWILVDDCSSDGTDKIAKEILTEKSPFPIIHLRNKENRGKYYSTNRAVEIAQGEFFLMFDGDDELVPRAMEIYLNAWNSVPDKQKLQLKGITALRIDQNGNSVAPEFPEAPIVRDLFTMRFKNGCMGDYLQLVKTDIMKEYPFEENVDIKVLDSLTWLQMARVYKDLYINEIVMIYHINQDNHISLSTITKKIRFLKGFHYSYLHYINDVLTYIPNFKYKLKVIVWYYKFGRHCGFSNFKIFNDIYSLYHKLLLLMILPIGIYMVLKDRKGGRV